MAIALIGAAAVALGLVTAILGMVNQSRARKTAEKVHQISVEVDGRLSELLERQAQLLSALHAGGVPVPPKPGEEKGGAH